MPDSDMSSLWEQMLPLVACLFMLLVGGVVGKLWQEARSRGEGEKKGKLAALFANRGSLLVYALSGFPAAMLAGWKFKQATIVQGLGWVVGLVIGAWYGKRLLVKEFVPVDDILSPGERTELKSFVSRSLGELSHDRIEKRLKDKVASIRKRSTASLRKGVSSMHMFIHAVRDQAVPHYKELFERDIPKLFEEDGYLSHMNLVFDEFYGFMEKVSPKIIDLFNTITPGSDPHIWLALRTVSRDKHGKIVFQTSYRAGNVNKAPRDTHKQAISSDGPFISFLRNNFERGNGVVVFHNYEAVWPTKSNRAWSRSDSDELGDDLSIIAAPITLRQSGNNQMIMVLYVNSSTQALFSSKHDHFMRCVSDALSIVFSTFAAILYADNVQPMGKKS